MNIIPSVSIQTLGGILFFVAFIGSYILRKKHNAGSQEHIHYSYMIKTIWIFSILFLIGTLFSLILADHTAINKIVDGINTGNIPTEDAMMGSVLQFGMDNLMLFLIIFLPMIIYALYRFSKGLYFIRKNQIFKNPTGWL